MDGAMGEGRMGSNYETGIGFPFGVIEVFWN